jgi:general nucleoside transport system permease protein
VDSLLVKFLAGSVQAGTPLLFATLGESLTERVGNLNLGVEGLMLMGAVIGFNTALVTGNPALALLAAMAAGAAGSLIFAFLTVSLRANQVVSGLTLTIFGTGFAGFLGQSLTGKVTPDSVKAFFTPIKLPVLGDIPYLGSIFFRQDIFIYLGYLTAVVLGFYLFSTRPGLNLRAVGESPAAADASGVSVVRAKYIHTLLGGALCALGGAYLSLVYVPAWQENITAGRGWIAVALVIFTGWNPYIAILGSFFFGGLDIVGFRLQKYDIKISQYLIDALPYVVTILVLIASSVRKSARNSTPGSLGEPYFREER